ncbi:transposase [Streptomyces sp. NPDC017202]|uniref:transposase n=1 Tax=Streptomyces sp. NPDC017202 TaxID=3364981 RepID=UPI00378FA910
MRHLCERGLTGVRLVIGDHHLGLGKAIRKVTGGLCHPGGGRVGCRAQDADAPAGVPDHREHVQPRPGQKEG